MAKLKERPGPWSGLFDPSGMDHACEAVRVAIVNASMGEGAAMHVTLRRHLIGPLWAYIEAHWRPAVVTADVQAAYALEAEASKLAELFDEGHPFDESVAAGYADRLRLRWLEFIAHGAGPYVYHLVPEQHAQRVAAPKGKRRGWPIYVTEDDVAPTIASLPTNRTYEDTIDALCQRARANVPAGRRHPPGEPEAAAKRAYLNAVASGKVRPLRAPIADVSVT